MEYYNLLSQVTDYPKKNYWEVLNESIVEGNQKSNEVVEHLSKFKEYADKKDLCELEEIYTRTFDIKGQCCLDLGYVLFGEDYKRGDFLVHIQKMQRDNNIDTGIELPDHLTNVLKLVAVLDDETAKKLIEKIVMPALEKMLENFPAKSS
jgi:nitrate reductase molybdenum cofactor assembly chaperone